MDAATTSGKPDNDVVKLSLPASTPYARIARVGAAALANRWGFSQRQVQDLRLAVDEAVILLMSEKDAGAVIALEYRIAGNLMSIAGSLDHLAGAPPLGDEAISRFQSLAGELLASYELDAAERKVKMTLHRE